MGSAFGTSVHIYLRFTGLRSVCSALTLVVSRIARIAGFAQCLEWLVCWVPLERLLYIYVYITVYHIIIYSCIHIQYYIIKQLSKSQCRVVGKWRQTLATPCNSFLLHLLHCGDGADDSAVSDPKFGPAWLNDTIAIYCDVLKSTYVTMPTPSCKSCFRGLHLVQPRKASSGCMPFGCVE